MSSFVVFSSFCRWRMDDMTRVFLRQLKEFKVRPFWDFECGAEAGRKALGEAEEALGIERKKLDTATHLCTLFEFPDAIKESQQMIADMQSNCKLMYKVRNSSFSDSLPEYYATLQTIPPCFGCQGKAIWYQTV